MRREYQTADHSVSCVREGREEGEESDGGGRGRREGGKDNRPIVCHCDVCTYPKQASMDQSSQVSGVSAVLCRLNACVCGGLITESV